jgi:hypothetical protein
VLSLMRRLWVLLQLTSGVLPHHLMLKVGTQICSGMKPADTGMILQKMVVYSYSIKILFNRLREGVFTPSLFNRRKL